MKIIFGSEMELPFLIAHLSLFTDDGSRPLDMGSSPSGEAPPRRLLYGNLVSSPQKLRDLQGRLGLYFLFPDASIRWRGRFQLGISLLRISEYVGTGMRRVLATDLSSLSRCSQDRCFWCYEHCISGHRPGTGSHTVI